MEWPLCRTTSGNTPYPLPATHCLYTLYFDTRKGGGEVLNQRERKRGNSRVEIITTWLTVFNSKNNCRKVITGKKILNDDILLWCL